MSGGITIGFVDVVVFFINPIAFVARRLAHFWCEHAWSCKQVEIDIYRLYRRTLFRMIDLIIERVDLTLSRLKQGFDSSFLGKRHSTPLPSAIARDASSAP
ncbi:hypothetical protein ACVWWG_001429 [Bradyrhizobium sp. LB7.2]|uniref:hypothetical protein n=1 Tax=Bradyrhizobium sp. LB14.3 TaxID=3156328 RepID=UPI0033963052